MSGTGSQNPFDPENWRSVDQGQTFTVQNDLALEGKPIYRSVNQRGTGQTFTVQNDLALESKPISAKELGSPEEFALHPKTRSQAPAVGAEGENVVRLVAGGSMVAGMVPKPLGLSGAKDGSYEQTVERMSSLAVSPVHSGGPSLSEKLLEARVHVAPAVETPQKRVEVPPRSCQAAELSPLPQHMKNLTSCIARIPPGEMFGLLAVSVQTLPGITVDLRPPTEKMKLKGVCFRGGSKAHFLITLFKNQHVDVVIVCQRQQGCVQLFTYLFRSLLTRLGDSIESQGDSAELPPVFACPPSFRSDTSARFVLEPLLHRARSNYIDLQLEAGAALLELTQGPSLALQEEDKVELLSVAEQFLLAEHEDLHRMGSVLAKNLLESKSVSTISDTLRSRMQQMLAGPATYLNRDSKRHLATALRCVDPNPKRAAVPFLPFVPPPFLS